MPEPDDKQTWMRCAANDGDNQRVVELLKDGANVNSINFHKNTALHMSVLHGHAQVVQTLIQHGANINLTNVNGQTPLQLACVQGHLDIVKMLTNKGCHLHIQTGFSEMTALHFASKAGKADICQHLLDVGAEEEQLDAVDKIAEYYAANYPTELVFKKYREKKGGKKPVNTAIKKQTQQPPPQGKKDSSPPNVQNKPVTPPGRKIEPVTNMPLIPTPTVSHKSESAAKADVSPPVINSASGKKKENTSPSLKEDSAKTQSTKPVNKSEPEEKPKDGATSPGIEPPASEQAQNNSQIQTQSANAAGHNNDQAGSTPTNQQQQGKTQQGSKSPAGIRKSSNQSQLDAQTGNTLHQPDKTQRGSKSPAGIRKSSNQNPADAQNGNTQQQPDKTQQGSKSPAGIRKSFNQTPADAQNRNTQQQQTDRDGKLIPKYKTERFNPQGKGYGNHTPGGGVEIPKYQKENYDKERRKMDLDNAADRGNIQLLKDHSFHWSDQHKAKMRLSVFDRLGAGGRKKKDDQGAAAAAGGKPGDKTGDAAGKSGSPQQNRK